MPPVSKAGGSAFRKDVEFVAKDDDEQIAAGIVMVPDKVDLQNDFAREETIREFADQFEAFVEAGQAGGGVMHAVWPDDWMALERNEVLDEAEEIGGTEAPAGAWVQEWAINNDDLWSVITDGILEGYSIGAIQVDWDGPFEQDADAVDDVAVPDAIDDEALVWELVDGIIREVSAVDIPAVPDAQILDTKADTEKRLGDYLGDRDGFIDEALERGHSEAEAERLWELLNDAVETEGSAEPGKQSMFARAGKAFLSALSGSGSGSDDDTEAKTSEAPDRGRDRDRESNKEGRTLSTANRNSLFATIDASLDVLEDAGVDHGMTRFTDRDDVGFDLSEHSAREWPNPDNDDEEDEDEESAGTTGPPFESAAGGETPDDNTTMSDNDDPWEDAPEWAKDLRDNQEENSKRIDEIATTDDEGEEKDAWEDAPVWAKDLKDQQEKNADRIDTISKQTGTNSQQIGKVENEESEKGTGFTLDPRKAGR
ncbi:XkdF-like putative serine protease domain-containing protein [Halosolutus halophilus]|uniref:XkdF-like putative serine protease domain-containing protein n=1 Tax=Halosolutus halophilus TaxID=1552990 RepID=UPI00223511D4|nr:XkdF-like putative serine protease domain-containing protein [Halosolutus halophilus]